MSPTAGGAAVALVPAFRAEATIGATVQALATIEGLDEIVVIDDGSTDETTALARQAGSHVVSLAVKRGEGGAVGRA
jgi:glycosyltransferase involved in cell wall biosynthesis